MRQFQLFQWGDSLILWIIKTNFIRSLANISMPACIFNCKYIHCYDSGSCLCWKLLVGDHVSTFLTKPYMQQCKLIKYTATMLLPSVIVFYHFSWLFHNCTSPVAMEVLMLKLCWYVFCHGHSCQLYNIMLIIAKLSLHEFAYHRNGMNIYTTTELVQINVAWYNNPF